MFAVIYSDTWMPIFDKITALGTSVIKDYTYISLAHVDICPQISHEIIPTYKLIYLTIPE